jgi:DsbC/DsbD-like thiol-disulfide interchange protein
MKFIDKILIAVGLLLIAGYVNAQMLSSKDVLDINAELINTDPLVIELKLDIKEGWHINSNNPLDEFLTPTVVTIKDSTLFSKINIEYPAPEILKLEFSETELSLFHEVAVIKVTLIPNENFNKKNFTIEGEVAYQPCNDQTCLFPTKKNFTVNFKKEVEE